MTEEEGRAAVLAEAMTWLGTPYRHRGRIKGPNGAVDCAQFVWAVYYNCGLTPFLEDKDYPPDWFRHRGEERFMEILMGRATEVEFPKPGDVALFRIGRLMAHGAIITAAGWPNVIHAYSLVKCVTLSRLDGAALSDRSVRYFSRWQASSAAAPA